VPGLRFPSARIARIGNLSAESEAHRMNTASSVMDEPPITVPPKASIVPTWVTIVLVL